jgi:hypothetical protein
MKVKGNLDNVADCLTTYDDSGDYEDIDDIDILFILNKSKIRKVTLPKHQYLLNLDLKKCLIDNVFVYLAPYNHNGW